jgi:protein-tyrosine-phosphatase
VNKKTVLFVCIGNCIRSQMAEAFARVYGKDVIEPSSAGVAPAGFIADDAIAVMAERGILMDGQFSKDLVESGGPFDIAVNMSGETLPSALAREIRTWPVADPMGKKRVAYEQAAAQIENLVMALVLDLRVAQRGPKAPTRPATPGTQTRA